MLFVVHKQHFQRRSLQFIRLSPRQQ